jgi:transglycosylase-like protein with SLT domain
MQIMKRKPGWRASALALTAALGFCAARPAIGAERITLANGFDLICNHHQIIGGKVRVYLKASEPDYFELQPENVTGYETVPDPPAETKAGGTASVHPPAFTDAKKPETRLTPDDLHQLLSKAGVERNVDEDLLASVVKAESGGNVRATSRVGAQGLMQLMPGTAHQLGVADSFAPDQNVRGGAAYLDGLLTRYHDNLVLALAAYNAGPEAVDRYHGIPPYHETRVYVARVVHEFNRRVEARAKLAKQSLASAAIATPASSSMEIH